MMVDSTNILYLILDSSKPNINSMNNITKPNTAKICYTGIDIGQIYQGFETKYNINSQIQTESVKVARTEKFNDNSGQSSQGMIIKQVAFLVT